jgi:hypothetical protein
MPPMGHGLADTLELALERWRPRLVPNGVRTPFGAAGRRGLRLDLEISDLVSKKRELQVADLGLMTDPMQRLFNTNIGPRAVNAARNETRTLVALQRLSVEIIAASLECTNQVRHNDRLLVIPERPGRPPNVMQLSPQVATVDDSSVISDHSDRPLSWLETVLPVVADLSENTPEAIVLGEAVRGGPEAVAGTFLVAQPEIVRTRLPQMIRLCVPTPHMRLDSGATISTAGLFCRDADLEIGITVCHHGTGPRGRQVALDYKVKRDNKVQDIVFIPLREEFDLPKLLGRGGVLEEREPARADHVSFDGATNQNCKTRIFSADAGMLRARPTIMLKLQTDPDTDQGDSGCALIDEGEWSSDLHSNAPATTATRSSVIGSGQRIALRSLQLTPI